MKFGYNLQLTGEFFIMSDTGQVTNKIALQQTAVPLEPEALMKFAESLLEAREQYCAGTLGSSASEPATPKGTKKPKQAVPLEVVLPEKNHVVRARPGRGKRTVRS